MRISHTWWLKLMSERFESGFIVFKRKKEAKNEDKR